MGRDPESFDAIELFDSIGRKYNLDLNDERASRKVLRKFATAVRASRANPIVLHGRRVELMFGFVAVALGGCRFVKREDTGEVASTGSDLIAPDYRLVLNSGQELFVEVKNCHTKGLNPTLEFKDAYLQKLQGYAALFGKPLKLAIYWSRWNLWTLVPTSALTATGIGRQGFPFNVALKRNEMVELGDVMLGTTPPLVFRLVADRTKPRHLGKAKTVVFTIGDVRFFVGGVEITERAERSLAFYLMAWGGWPEDPPNSRIENNELEWIEVAHRPVETDEHHEFEFVSHVSTMISRRYNDLTTSGHAVTRLAPPVEPKSLAVTIPGKVADLTLPLWVFHMKPSTDP